MEPLINFVVILHKLIFNRQVEMGTLVELYLKGEPLYGVIQWLGNLPPPDHHTKMAGIELVKNV